MNSTDNSKNFQNKFLTPFTKEDTLHSTTENDPSIITALAYKWNESILNRDYESLSELYMDEVVIYSTNRPKQEAIKNKKEFFRKFPDFKQSILDSISISKNQRPNSYKFSFLKQIQVNGKVSQFKASLAFDKIGETWKIYGEYNEQEDIDITKRILNIQNNENVSCPEIILLIIKSSQSYKNLLNELNDKIQKNEIKSFKFIFYESPYPEIDGTFSASDDDILNRPDVYQFKITAIYLLGDNKFEEDEKIATFHFSMKNQQLYYRRNKLAINGNIVEHVNMKEEFTYEPVDFNKTLLVKFNKNCN